MNNPLTMLHAEYRARLGRCPIADANVWWDPWHQGFAPSQRADMAGWLAGLEENGTGTALITNAKSARYSAPEGNAELAALIQGQERLYGCMVLTPELPEGYVDEMAAQGMVAARLFPRNHGHGVAEAAPLLDALQAREMPLILWHTQVEWAQLEEILSGWPYLPVILDGNNTKLLYHAHRYNRLMTVYDNLYLETHNLVLVNEIAALAGRFGAHRLIYGSFYPYNTPHHALFNLLYSGLDETALGQVLGGNLKQLIAKQKHSGWTTG